MNLTKFLRKHTKAMLMVFMALLLVAFLIPQQIQGCSDQARMQAQDIGQAFDRESIDSIERMQAAQELELLQLAGLVPPNQFTPIDYYLLREEARRAGIYFGEDEVIGLLKQAGLTDQALKNLQRRSDRSYREIYQIFGNWLAAQRLASIQATALVESLPRQRHAFRDRRQAADVHVSRIDAEAFVHTVPEPTEEQLVAFFEEAKDRVTEHTAEELRFGYQLPDRVQVEYLTVEPRDMERLVRVSRRDIQQHYDDYQDRYTKPNPNATQPASGQPARIPMTLDEAADQIREELRREESLEEAQRVIGQIREEVAAPWLAQERREDGFRELPTGELLSFQALAEEYGERYPVQFERTELLDQNGLVNEWPLGQASISEGGQFVSVPQMAMRVKGILEEDPNDGLTVLNLMEPAPLAFTRDSGPRGGREPRQPILFRVVQVAPAAPPDALDDVRDEVVRDWKVTQAFEKARDHAEQLAERAREVGLATAIEEATELKQILEAAEVASTQPAGSPSTPTPFVERLGPVEDVEVIRGRTFLQGVGVVGELPDRVFSLVNDPGTTTAPAHPVTVVPAATQQRWIVAEVANVESIYAGQFEQQLTQSVTMPQSRFQANRGFSMMWLAPQSIKNRTNFQPVLEAGDEE